MKQDIINFVMSSLFLYNIHNWERESAKDFCKLILDGEDIDYQEEDFNNVVSSNTETRTIEIVKKYAEMYFEIYKPIDFEKAKKMNEIIYACDRILHMSNSIDDIFSDVFKETKPERAITIKEGESICFSNGVGSNLTPEDLEALQKIAFKDEKQEKQPFTIHFNDSVPQSCREEIMKRVSTIYEEVVFEMKEKTR